MFVSWYTLQVISGHMHPTACKHGPPRLTRALHCYEQNAQSASLKLSTLRLALNIVCHGAQSLFTVYDHCSYQQCMITGHAQVPAHTLLCHWSILVCTLASKSSRRPAALFWASLHHQVYITKSTSPSQLKLQSRQVVSRYFWPF